MERPQPRDDDIEPANERDPYSDDGDDLPADYEDTERDGETYGD